MAVTIEKEYGRQKLIETICSAPALLSTYNDAVADAKSKDDVPAVWSQEIIKALAPITN
jgi:hypothetical protein